MTKCFYCSGSHDSYMCPTIAQRNTNDTIEKLGHISLESIESNEKNSRIMADAIYELGPVKTLLSLGVIG